MGSKTPQPPPKNPGPKPPMPPAPPPLEPLLPRYGTRRFTFECLRSGQPRPYADSEYEYIITVEWVPYGGSYWMPNDISDSIVKKTARGFCDVKFPEDSPDWHESIVKSFTKTGPGTWRLFATRAYSD